MLNNTGTKIAEQKSTGRKVTGLGRRAFLKTGAAAGGCLVIGFYLPAFASRKAKAVDSSASFSPNVWVKIGVDDSVTIVCSQVEMGQGVMTAMPMMIADELDADWSKVKLEWAGADPIYGDLDRNRIVATIGSRSTRKHWEVFRKAGATGRAMLVTAAAQTWGVPESSCSTGNSEVLHSASGRRLRYGQLVAKASTVPVPDKVSLKQPKDFHLIGYSLARVDIPQKVNGSALYGMDVKQPNMLIARVLRCPVFGGKVASFNGNAAKSVAGVHEVVEISSGVAVIADSYWAATQGSQALDVKWDEGPNAELSSEEIRKHFNDAAKKPGAVARNDGHANEIIAGATKKLEAIYEVPYLAHATMEPQNCTAYVHADGCDVWASTQSQTTAMQAAVQATGLPPEKVQVHPMFLGGGFGRRGESDYVSEAVECSKAVGRPVKVIWTREDDIKHDFYRPVTTVRFEGAIDDSGMPVAWLQRIVQPSLNYRADPKSLAAANGVDSNSVNGASTMPYAIPNIRVEYVQQEPGVPIGYWRSVGSSVNGYVVDAFLDELAAAGKKDPYELRRTLLAKSPRNLAVLELVGEKAGWGKPLPKGHHQGIGMMEAFGSFCAEIAEVSVSPDGNVRVHRVVCGVDCGWTINPDTIKAQLESGMVYALTAALKGEITIKNGRVVQSNFHDYQMLRMNEMPKTEVYIVPSSEDPGGIGEPSTPPLFSALVNAIYAATGKRIRRLPIRAEDLRTA